MIKARPAVVLRPDGTVDLAAHYRDIDRLARTAKTFVMLAKLGRDTDDLMQTAWEAIITKNSPTSASRYDPAKGSLSKWVYLVVNGRLLNDEDKRIRRPETVGIDSGDEGVVDAQVYAEAHLEGDAGDTEDAAAARLPLVGEVGLYLAQGHTLLDARRAFGMRHRVEVDRLARRLAASGVTTRSVQSPAVTTRDARPPSHPGRVRVTPASLVPYARTEAAMARRQQRLHLDTNHLAVIERIAERDCCSVSSVLTRMVVRSLERDGYIEVTPDPAPRASR